MVEDQPLFQFTSLPVFIEKALDVFDAGKVFGEFFFVQPRRIFVMLRGEEREVGICQHMDHQGLERGQGRPLHVVVRGRGVDVVCVKPNSPAGHRDRGVCRRGLITKNERVGCDGLLERRDAIDVGEEVANRDRLRRRDSGWVIDDEQDIILRRDILAGIFGYLHMRSE